MIQCARLPLSVPIQHLQKEVISLTSGWHPHFNTKHYEGSWTVLPLRSPAGSAQQIIPEVREEEQFADTDLMEYCPTVRSLLEKMDCSKMAVRLMNLKAGAIIKEHRDHDLAIEKGEARLHFPVFTNPSVSFYVNGEDVKMQEGECWYVNVNLPHKVANYGKTDRIHLVIDCVVNDWLKDMFAQAYIVEAQPKLQNEETLKVIHELRLQNTGITNRLADELEQKLGAQ